LVRALKIALVLLPLWVPISWVLADFLVVESVMERPDALVVLGGSAEYVERTALAAHLFKQGRAGYVVLTDDGRRGGWNQEQQRNPFFVENARESLIASGVPAEAVLIPPKVTDGTDDEAVVVLQFAAGRGFTSIELITSAYHTRRASIIFESHRVRLGSSCAIGISATRGGELDPTSYVWWTSLDGLRTVTSEYAKLAYFRIWN
jgi:uncharacterized SAM-binding protein YcdF (DUF218 family)